MIPGRMDSSAGRGASSDPDRVLQQQPDAAAPNRPMRATDAAIDSEASDAASPALPSVPVQVKPAAQSEFCGDAIRDPVIEECDDGTNGAGDSCSSCEIRDILAVPAGTPPDAGERAIRYLGDGRHPVAAGSSGFAVAHVAADGDRPSLGLSVFEPLGARTAVVRDLAVGSSPLFFSNPVVAALPDGTYAAAWTDFDIDGDQLGIALRRVDPATPPSERAEAASAFTGYSQYDPDILWTGNELVVAWVDDATTSTAPDLYYRRFDDTLSPLGDDLPLAATDAVETHVSLANFNGNLAAAWRETSDDLTEHLVIESLEPPVQWRVGPLTPGPATDWPALAPLDDTHLLIAFTEGTDPHGAGAANTGRLRAAVLSTAQPGTTASFPIEPLESPYAAEPALAQTQPTAVAVDGRVYVGWRSEATGADDAGDELWIKFIPWDGTNAGLDRVERPLPRQSAHRSGDQLRPAFAASPLEPAGAVVAAWDDYAQTTDPGQGQPDVVAELIPSPLVRFSCENGVQDLNEDGVDCGPACDTTCCTPTDEVCDGEDNDCDGEIDEGDACASTCSPSPELCADGVDNDCDGVTDEGQLEICDGIDNDCDGVADEGCCTIDPGGEQCGDNLDNDCDGQVDEGCATCTQYTATPQEHINAGRAYSCGFFDWFACVVGSDVQLDWASSATQYTLIESSPGYYELGTCPAVCQPSSEICGDGLDNDCDGSVDEDCTTCTEYTSTVSDHISAGRAVTCGWFGVNGCAVGSGDDLGSRYDSIQVTIAETSPGYFEAGSCP